MTDILTIKKVVEPIARSYGVKKSIYLAPMQKEKQMKIVI